MYGATKEQWDHFVSIGLTHDLLPVVSNPNAKISAKSALRSTGKVPSKYYNGEVGGILNWTQKNATDKAIIEWSEQPDYGICIQTRHLRALDVDIDSDLADEIKQTILNFVPTAVFRTRENSKKFVFPFFLDGTFSKRIIETKQGAIEFLGNGQQFVACGTHTSGAKYNLPLTTYPTLPEEDFEVIFNHILEQFGTVAVFTDNKARQPDIDMEDDVLPLLLPHSLGLTNTGMYCLKCPKFDEHTDKEKGSISQSGYFPKGKGGNPKGHFHCSHNHNETGKPTASDWAVAYNLIDFGDDEPVVEIQAESSQNLSEIQAESKHDQELVIPRGLIKDTVDWILSCALQPQPELTLLNVISFAGAVFGRRYEYDKFGTRTNMYLVGIANTGDGKDHSRKCIKKLAELSNLSRFVGPDAIKSGEGVLTMLMKKPSVLMMLDEFGMLMASIGGSNAQPYLRSCAKIFTELYSSSSVLYQGGMYSDPKKDPVNIECPNLCIYGTSTQVKYAEALTPDAIDSGELNRFVVLKPKIENPEYNFNVGDRNPPDDLVNRWHKIADSIEVNDLMGGQVYATNVASEYNMNEILIYQRQRKMELQDGTGPLYARYTENVIKIAMVFAISENHNDPLMSSLHIDIAKQIVDASIDFVRSLVKSGIGTKDRREDPLIDEMFAYIRDEKPTKRDISRKFGRLHHTDIDKIIDTLTYQARIKLEKTPGKTKPIMRYVSA